MKAVFLLIVIAISSAVYGQHQHGPSTTKAPKPPVWLDNGLGNVDHTLVVVDLRRFAMFAGGSLEVSPRIDLSVQAYGQRYDGVTFRIGGGYRIAR